MIKESFSAETKKELSAHIAKNKCCKVAELYGIFLFAKKGNGNLKIKCDNKELADHITELVKEGLRQQVDIFFEGKSLALPASCFHEEYLCAIEEYLFRCPHCASSFLRGVFLTRGRVTDPSKAYHLEIVFKQEVERNIVHLLLASQGIEMRTGQRKTDYLLYMKGSTEIEDFLGFIGCNKSYFEFMNRKIVKEVRNNANRAANCDTGNIRKSMEAAKRQVDAVKLLIEKGKFDALPDDLKETARARIDNPSLTLDGLAAKMNPPISKSGLNHRLEKLMRIAEEID